MQRKRVVKLHKYKIEGILILGVAASKVTKTILISSRIIMSSRLSNIPVWTGLVVVLVTWMYDKTRAAGQRRLGARWNKRAMSSSWSLSRTEIANEKQPWDLSEVYLYLYSLSVRYSLQYLLIVQAIV